MKRLLTLSAALLALILTFSLCAEYISANHETLIQLSDQGITVDGGPETETVFASHDIIYYEDREFYDGGHPYGEGLPQERHSAQEAAAHTVVNITAPGTYRLTGRLSAGQIRVDLGKDAYYDPNAVVKLILSDADITCTVAPAILFLNVYECDGNWKTQNAPSEIDTTHAGANLILEGKNTVNGSHVARIYKDNGKRKKLWKQDGAIYSYMTLNLDGPGQLDLTADLEGISTELHLSMWDGDIRIRSMDDGINASEDCVSVVTIYGGFLRILSGLQETEGDGIDSNGYIGFSGGTTVVWATPRDASLDGDYGTFTQGGTVIAMGSNEELAHKNSCDPGINLVGCFLPEHDSSLAITDENGTVVLGFDPNQDEFFRPYVRPYAAVILGSPDFAEGKTYFAQLGASFSGEHTNGIYRNAAIQTPGIPMQRGKISKEDGVLIFQEEDRQTDLYMDDRVCTFKVAPLS